MSFIQLAKRRYSVRNYTSQPVEEEKLGAILEAGRVAPTGANVQPQRILLLREKDSLERLKKAANVFGAPAVLVVCGDVSAAWTRPFDGKNILDIDLSIVTDHMMLAATDLGLGTLWVCYFDPEIIKKEFNLPENIVPVNILAVGYASGEPQSADRHEKERKPLKETVFYESF